MNVELSTTAATFARALQAFQSGGLTRDGFLERLREWLAEGVPADELGALLRLRESKNVLPPAVYQAVAGVLEQASSAQAHYAADADADDHAHAHALDDQRPTGGLIPPEDPTVVLEETRGETDDVAAVDGLTQPVMPSALIGDTLLGRYYLIELIGEGGMSRVYRAIDTERPAEDPYVAVKIMTRGGGETAAALTKFREEFSKLRDLVHPNIVRLLVCERDRDRAIVFIVMEYLVGESLYARLHSVQAPTDPSLKIDRDRAISIVRSIGDALTHAHEHGIVHGDLKPGNVIVTNAWHVKVIDFALSTWMTRPAFTPRYASPQQIARQPSEPSDDVFALGCLTYELLTGNPPFVGKNGERTQRFPPPVADLSTDQYSAITHALELQRGDRTPTVQQFMQELDGSPRSSPWARRALWASGIACLLALIGFYTYRTKRADLVPVPLVRDGAPALPQATPQDVAASGRKLPAAGSQLVDCPDCPPLNVLPKGQFEQGSASTASPYDKPQHRVSIGYEVAFAINDVTVGNFSRFVAATGRPMAGCDIYDGQWHHKATADWQAPGFAQGPQHPVVCTSWNDAVAYAQWLSTATGHHYRLPSAAEWEYAARAGSVQDVPWGTDGRGACAQANVADQSAVQRYPGWQVFTCNDGFVNTSPVGSFAANEFGLNDTLGNVFQWTQDCWHPDYAGAPTDGSARNEVPCTDRELRGGSWFSTPDHVRTSYRNHFAADYRTSSVGFRVVRDLDP